MWSSPLQELPPLPPAFELLTVIEEVPPADVVPPMPPAPRSGWARASPARRW